MQGLNKSEAVRRLLFAFSEQCNVVLLNGNGMIQRLNNTEPVNLAT